MKQFLIDLVRVRIVLHSRMLALLLATIAASFAEPAFSGDAVVARPPERPITKYTAGHLVLHTDLPSEDAQSLLRRLKATLRTLSSYWRRSCDRRIVFYVVDDLARWSDDALPNPNARVVLEHIGGAMELPARPSVDVALEAHVYARSPGIAEHELVHAYCMLAFGTCGPDWYKEGMAEMARYQNTRKRAVRCPQRVVQMLRADRARPLQEFVHVGPFTKPIAERFRGGGKAHGGEQAEPILWQAEDDDVVRTARKSYHRSWALCYFLTNHPGYRDRFRQLGIGYLNQSGVDFTRFFQPVADRLAFEFELFLRDLDAGYRVDLCRWDWDSDFSPLAENEQRTVRVLASRGYQSSGLLVSENDEYEYVAEGRWSTCSRRPASTADGSYFGQGSLEGVILNGYDLGQPFEMGASGSFIAERTGKLYLRCRDDWNRIADNHGTMEVHLRTND